MSISVLFPHGTAEQNRPKAGMPEYFSDLLLDTVFTAIFRAQENYEPEDYYYRPLDDLQTIIYRQDILRDLENDALSAAFKVFSSAVYEIREKTGTALSDITSGVKWRDNYLARGSLFHCVELYCSALFALRSALLDAPLNSEGLRALREYVGEYCASSFFTELWMDTVSLRREFDTVKYSMHIKTNSIRVRKYDRELDLARDIESVFGKFKQVNEKQQLRYIPESEYEEDAEAAVLDLAAGQYKAIFRRLNGFCEKYAAFFDDSFMRLGSEVNFYLSWLEYIRPLRDAGLSFCYPTLSDDKVNVRITEGYDIALAKNNNGYVVANDCTLTAPEHIIVISGPNQGGKTTFSRAFAQAHYLASLGLSVPAKSAELMLCDAIYTHFGREESADMESGQLQDELLRLHAILSSATRRSIIILNEIFSSTTLQDAGKLGEKMMEHLKALGCTAIVITFLDNLIQGAETVSMVGEVERDDPAKRTYKIVRRPPDGLAYALNLAEKHKLTYDTLRERFAKKEAH